MHEDASGRDQFELWDEAPCGLLLTAVDGTILRVNRTFCAWIDRPADALVGSQRFQDLLPVGGRIFHQTHLLPLLEMQGSVSEVKLDLRTGAGPVPIMCNMMVRAGDPPTISCAVFIARERHAYERELMLARKRAEELVRQLSESERSLREASERKDEFLAMLAHELRNPLAPIASAAQLLQLGETRPERVRTISDILLRQSMHLTRLVDDLLDVSRVTRGVIALDRERLELATIVGAAVEQTHPLIDARRHALRVELPEPLPIEGDRTRLVQVVANLLNNAARYTPIGGRIAITGRAAGEHVELAVEDNGVGIEPELLPTVFDLFTQAKRSADRSQGGLGIGLALVRSLVRMHGGDVWGESAGPGRGSRFTVRLPRAPTRHEAASVRMPPSTATPSESVLVVDDNQDAAFSLAALLQHLGHRADTAHDGAEALQRASQSPYSVFMIDLGLPDIPGLDLIAPLRQFGDGALFVAVTGYGQAADRQRTLDAGFDEHLVKPVSAGAIAAIMARAARRGQPVGSV